MLANYKTHRGGGAQWDRLRRIPNREWTCLHCFKRTVVDPLAPGRCPRCDTEFWDASDIPVQLPTSYYTGDPTADPERLTAIVRQEEGWRWLIVRDLDGYPLAKGCPFGNERSAERDLDEFLARMATGNIVRETFYDEPTEDTDGNRLGNEAAASEDAAREP